MGFFNSLRNLKKWFTDRNGTTESKESAKRKHDDCEIINNKRARMDDSLVEVVVINDDSLSEAEEVDITEPGPSTMPLRASPPVMLIDDRHCRNRTILSSSVVDLTASNDDQNNIQTTQTCSPSNQSFISNRTMNMVGNANSKSSPRYSPTMSIKGKKKFIFYVVLFVFYLI